MRRNRGEALRNRRPVICSDIGGMAEKVRDGLDGFHFAVGNAQALSALLLRLHDEPARLRAVRETIRPPAAAAEPDPAAADPPGELLPQAARTAAATMDAATAALR